MRLGGGWGVPRRHSLEALDVLEIALRRGVQIGYSTYRQVDEQETRHELEQQVMIYWNYHRRIIILVDCSSIGCGGGFRRSRFLLRICEHHQRRL
jgi:hypothetical protein